MKCSSKTQRQYAKRMGIIVLLSAPATLASCSGVQEQAVTQLAADSQSIVTGSVSGSSNKVSQQYRLGAGDKIKLDVYNEEDLSGEFDLGAGGSLSLPLVGQISADGLTVQEFEQKLTEKLKVYLKDPKVSAQVLTYRPFYISGEVKTGGEYPYSNGLVVRDAVAKAGGYTYRAVTSHVYIRRANETIEIKYPLDRQVKVWPGDNIRVPERIF